MSVAAPAWLKPPARGSGIHSVLLTGVPSTQCFSLSRGNVFHAPRLWLSGGAFFSSLFDPALSPSVSALPSVMTSLVLRSLLAVLPKSLQERAAGCMHHDRPDGDEVCVY